MITLTTRHGSRYRVIEPATRDKCYALCERLDDGVRHEIYYEDLRRNGTNAAAFYGIELVDELNKRLRRDLYDRTVRGVTAELRRG